MGRLSEYSEEERAVINLTSNVPTLDETRTRAYIDGRNAARSGYPREVPAYEDDLSSLNWLCGYLDLMAEIEG